MPPTNATAPPPIERRADLSYPEFARDYLFPLKPVVLAGALNEWPAVGKWTPDFFRRTFTDRELNVDGPIRCSEFIDRVEASNAEHPAPYLHAQHLGQVFPELLPDVEPRPVYLGPNWLTRMIRPPNLRERMLDHTSVEVYVGGKAAGFPFLHYDDYHYHAYIGQIFGLKKFFVYPPDQTPLVYPTPGRKHVALVKDVENPDLTKYPRFAEARALTCVLEPGDLLFMPCGWWHTTRMLSASISVAMNAVNASNWREFSEDLLEEMAAFHPRWKMWVFRCYLKWHGAIQSFKDRRASRPASRSSATA